MAHVLIQNLRKEYKNRRVARRGNTDPYNPGDWMRVLDDINLEFQKGEMVCILGPSGCGKSTMLRMIAGFDTPSAGQILINGEKVAGPRSDHIFVFQNSGLLPWMRIWENVELGIRHIKDEAIRNQKIQEHIDLVELTGFEHHYPYQLSGGMQRRAELARALIVNPDMLIMDEPFNGLDFLTHLRIREEIVNMHHYFGKTTLVVTHDIDDGLLMADRVVVLSGRPSQVKFNRKLDIPRPRGLKGSAALSELRDELFFMLGVSDAV